MSNPNSTEIVIVLDRSGSMSSIAGDMRGGFDTFVAEQRTIPGECLVTLAQFDTEYQLVYARRPVSDVPPLELVPRGSTALLDAIGRTIDATGARLAAMPVGDRPGRVLFVIITDGGENASSEYSAARVHEMIGHQRDTYAWDFVFMGANQDAIGVARGLGIQAQNAMNFVACKGVGTSSVMGSLSHSVRSYRGGQDLGDIQVTYDSMISGDKK